MLPRAIEQTAGHPMRLQMTIAGSEDGGGNRSRLQAGAYGTELTGLQQAGTGRLPFTSRDALA